MPQPAQQITHQSFELILTLAASRLTEDVRSDPKLQTAPVFEQRVRTALAELMHGTGIDVDLSPPAQSFPDIVLGDYGVEVKVSNQDSWRGVANSVFEGTRIGSVKFIYLIFGKMGGSPAVKWGRYEDCVMHVRTSHVPRFEVEIDTDRSLFAKFGVTYEEFRSLSEAQKMEHVRKYARARLKKGERLWWLEDEGEQPHTLPLQVRLYTKLEQSEKRKLRAEAALLCPEIVKGSRARDKYDDATLYLITYHGVLCSQARDLFSAGSVALRADETRGGNYVLRALLDIQEEMRMAAKDLEDALFQEYWGASVPPKFRIAEWLKRADELAKGWKPSDHLFQR